MAVNKKYSITETIGAYFNLIPVNIGLANVTQISKCPFHKQSKFCLVMIDGEERFICHECGVSGDAVDFIMQYECVDRKSAIKILESNRIRNKQKEKK